MSTTESPITYSISLRVIEAAGTIFGIAGALMIALRFEGFAYGWIGFAISSIAMAVFAFHIRAWGLLLLQICFVCTNGIGLWNWLILPAIQSGSIPLAGQF